MRLSFVVVIMFFLISTIVQAVSFVDCEEAIAAGVTEGKTCVEIDSCRILNGANTYYLLNQSVNSNRECFTFQNQGMTLDLNGHTLLFSDRQPVIVANFGFEAETGTSISSWDASGASDAQVVTEFPNAIGSWAPDEIQKNVLAFITPTMEQYVYSDELTLNPGEQYTLSLLAYRMGLNKAPGFAAVVDAADTVLCRVTDNSWPDLTQWAADNCNFDAPMGSVRVKLGVTGTLNGDSIYFDAVKVKPAGPLPRGHQEYDEDQAAIFIDGNRINNRVTNGVIKQGEEEFFYPIGILVKGQYGEIDHVAIELYGSDALGIYSTSSYTSVHDNTINLLGKRTHFGHEAVGGAIKFKWGDDNDVYNNHIIRSPGFGIGLDYYDPSPYTEIYNNTINIESSAIHCYALNIPVYGKVHDNFVNNTQGGGIAQDHITHAEIYNNYFEIRDGPQEERGWIAKAMWVRYNTGNLTIYNNTFIGYAGLGVPRPGADSALSVVRLGANDDTRGPIRFFNNYVEARTNAHTESSWAAALDLTTDGNPGVTKYIYNNTFASDDIVAQFGGNEYFAYAAGNKNKLVNNTFIKLPTAVSEFTTLYYGSGWYSGSAIGGVENVMTDTIVEGGADVHDIGFSTLGLRDLTIRWVLTVHTVNEMDLPINASVFITNPIDVDSTDIVTIDGIARANLIEQTYTGVGIPTITSYLPYNITATYMDQTQSVLFHLTEPSSITFTFAGNGSVVPACTLPYDAEPCDCIDLDELISSINGWYADDINITELIYYMKMWKAGC